MQKKRKQKLIILCLMLCTLLLASYATAFHPSGIDYLNDADSNNGKHFAFFFLGSENAPFSVDGGTTEKHNNSMTATNANARMMAFLVRQARWLNTKTNFDLFTEESTISSIYQFYATRLSGRIYTQFSANVVIAYLHKSDGMK